MILDSHSSIHLVFGISNVQMMIVIMIIAMWGWGVAIAMSELDQLLSHFLLDVRSPINPDWSVKYTTP